MKYYKKLDISVKTDKFVFEGKDLDSYITIINDYTQCGWTLNEILALPTEDKTSLIDLQVILETETESLSQ